MTLMLALAAGPARSDDAAPPAKEKTMSDYKKPSQEELRKRLTPEQFAVV